MLTADRQEMFGGQQVRTRSVSEDCGMAGLPLQWKSYFFFEGSPSR